MKLKYKNFEPLNMEIYRLSKAGLSKKQIVAELKYKNCAPDCTSLLRRAVKLELMPKGTN